MPEDGLVCSSPLSESQKKRRRKGISSGQNLIFIRIATRVSLHQDHPERNGKPECLPEILSTLVTHPDKNFGESTLQRSEVPIPTMQAHHEVFYLHYWIQLSSEIPRSVESITLPYHSHISNGIMPLLQCRLLRMEADISACRSQ